MESKPIISYFGNETVFAEIERYCVTNLQMEPVEWHRRYGRTVHVDVQFVPYSPDKIHTDKTEMIGKPAAHIFVLDNNIDMYRNSTKKNIDLWLSELRKHQIDEWLIVALIMEPTRPKSKLLPQKNSVLDKIKSDFNIRNASKYLILICDKNCGDLKAYHDSWQDLLKAIRRLVLDSYDQILSCYEDKIRERREARFDKDWNYFAYFALQEELASIYESVCLYEDALIQYDELEAVFVQCVDDFRKGERQAWLIDLAKLPCESLDLVILTHHLDHEKRQQVRARLVCLLDFRAYLLSRQSALLQQLQRTEEVASRAIDVIQSSLKEMKIMNVDIRGSILAGWIFMCSYQVIQILKRFSDESLIISSLDNAELWRLAVERLGELGRLCGLMPGTNENNNHSNEEELSALKKAMNYLDSLDTEDCLGETPYDKLALAISSKENFQSVYLELTELCLGIFKHVSRFRASRWLACDLADFYVNIGELQKAESLYYDALKNYKKENWLQLAFSIREKLAHCQKSLKNGQFKFIKSCLHLASANGRSTVPLPSNCCAHLNMEKRLYYWQEFLDTLTNHKAGGETIGCHPLIEICSIDLLANGLEEGRQKLKIRVHFHAPKSLAFRKLWLSAERLPSYSGERDVVLGYGHLNDNSRMGSMRGSIVSMESTASTLLSMNAYLDSPKKMLDAGSRKSSRELSDAFSLSSPVHNKRSSIVPRNLLPVVVQQRKNTNGLVSGIRVECRGSPLDYPRPSLASLPGLKDSNLHFNNHTDHDYSFTIENIELVPGLNEFVISANKVGFFVPSRVYLETIHDLCFVDNKISQSMSSTWWDINLVSQLMPTITFSKLENHSFLLGFEEHLAVEVCCGSLALPSRTPVALISRETGKTIDETIVNDSDHEMTPGTSCTTQKKLRFSAESVEDEFLIRIDGFRVFHLPAKFIQPFSLVPEFHGTWNTRLFVGMRIDCLIPWDETFHLLNASLTCIRDSDSKPDSLPITDPDMISGDVNRRWTYTLLWSLPPSYFPDNPLTFVPRFQFQCEVARDICPQSEQATTVVTAISHAFLACFDKIGRMYLFKPPCDNTQNHSKRSYHR